MSLMGVDIGTSSCKAVVFSESGRMLASAAQDYSPTFLEGGRVEMDAHALWRAAAWAIREAAAQARDPVVGLTISSHGETFVPVDPRGEPMGPAILNADNRAAAEAAEWEQGFGRRRTFEITGTVVHPAFPLLKLRWLRSHQPELFRRAARFASVSDYALLRLGLPPYIGHSLASRFLLFDVRRHCWSEEILTAAGLSPEQLPIPAPAGAVAGRLSAGAAAELGLRAGTLVAVGGHDQACGAVGMGAIRPGMVSDSLGSYECVVHVDDHPRLDEAALAANLNSYCHVVPGHYITIVYFPSGMMVKWYCDLLSGEEAANSPADLYEQLEAKAPPGPTGLCITPHLIGSATPHFDSRATGAIVGLTPATDRYQLYKGILEGIASELAIVTEVLAGVVGPFDAIRASGGGARSALGLRLRATITGRRIQTLESPEAVCLGAALLAGVAAGVYRDLPEAVEQAVRVVGTIEPDPDEARAYARQLRQYRLLYPALAPLREL